jgi:hypothetical protein
VPCKALSFVDVHCTAARSTRSAWAGPAGEVGPLAAWATGLSAARRAHTSAALAVVERMCSPVARRTKRTDEAGLQAGWRRRALA